MPKRISDEKLMEYDELKKFFCHWFTHISPLDVELNHPGHPINSLAFLESKYGLSKALVGLKQAIGDIVESSQDFSAAQIVQADLSLNNAGIVRLSEIIRRQSRQYKAILRRATIRNDAEYYLLNAVLSDTTLSLPDAEIDLLNTLVSKYESSKV